MLEKRDRVIFDTNIWISYLISDEFSSLDTLIIDQYIDLIYSEELLEEFIAVARRGKFSRYFTENDVNYLVDGLLKFAEFFDVKSNFNLCRDPRDNFLLSLSFDAQATHLITGDKDLLEIEYFYGTRILDYAGYIKSKSFF